MFDGPLGRHYVPNDKYENVDAFDAAFRWTKREERSLRRKIDIKIFLWILVMFTALDVRFIRCMSPREQAADRIVTGCQIDRGRQKPSR